MQPRQPLLKVGQVSKRLGVSDPTVYRLDEAGILPAVEIARRKRKRILRWRPEAVEAFITAREPKAMN